MPRAQFVLALSYALKPPHALAGELDDAWRAAAAVNASADAGIAGRPGAGWAAVLEDLYDAWDVGGAGAVDYREFVASVALFRRGPQALAVAPEQLVGAWYAAYDGLAAGGLPPADFLAMLTTLAVTTDEARAVAAHARVDDLIAFCGTGAVPRRGLRAGSLLWQRFDEAGALVDGGIGGGGSEGRGAAGAVGQQQQLLPPVQAALDAYQRAALRPHAAAWGYGGTGVSDDAGDAGTSAVAAAAAAEEARLAAQAAAAYAAAAAAAPYARPVRPGCIDERGIHLLFRLSPQLSHALHRQRLARATPAQRAGFLRRALELETQQCRARFAASRCAVGAARADGWLRFVTLRKALAGWAAWRADKRLCRALVRSFAARRCVTIAVERP